jgi:tetratricopeptide (TPR) repeat protein
MLGVLRWICAGLSLLIGCCVFASVNAEQNIVQSQVDALDKPLYTPFIERYVLDELKQLRTDMAAQKVDFVQQITDREHSAIDRAVSYATNTVTYFFYVIAAASSVLVLVGWTSIRDMKERVHTLADEEITRLVRVYEARLESIEKQLNQKTQHIEQNREEIVATNEIQSLWLRAGQESNPANKITVYDQILKIRGDDCEALTYKADAVLELGEPQWAANLCHQALLIDPDNGHAFYQLACAYTAMKEFDEAVRMLGEALLRTESYRQEIIDDPVLIPLHSHPAFNALLGRA